MQQILPIFPQDMKAVNYQVGFKQIDDFVHYFVNGMPVYCHEKDDKNGYRFVLATLVNNVNQGLKPNWHDDVINNGMSITYKLFVFR